MADKLWILVGNASRVRLFSADSKGENWALLEEFFHDDSRAKNEQLMNQPENPNGGSLRKPAPENEPGGRKELEHERFAQELSQRLDRGVDDRQFDRLIIAAPPTFLGRLRRVLSTRVRQRVVLDLDADYTNVPSRDLPSRVPVL
jgi:protein required for attachment to host cells